MWCGWGGWLVCVVDGRVGALSLSRSMDGCICTSPHPHTSVSPSILCIALQTQPTARTARTNTHLRHEEVIDVEELGELFHGQVLLHAPVVPLARRFGPLRPVRLVLVWVLVLVWWVEEGRGRRALAFPARHTHPPTLKTHKTQPNTTTQYNTTQTLCSFTHPPDGRKGTPAQRCPGRRRRRRRPTTPARAAR